MLPPKYILDKHFTKGEVQILREHQEKSDVFVSSEMTEAFSLSRYSRKDFIGLQLNPDGSNLEILKIFAKLFGLKR